jgi:hypothetical protein
MGGVFNQADTYISVFFFLERSVPTLVKQFLSAQWCASILPVAVGCALQKIEVQIFFFCEERET